MRFTEPAVTARRSYAAPLSYVGSARRIIGWARRFRGGALALAVAGAIVLIPAAWLVVSAWYGVTLALFGVWVFPYRFARRGERKRLHLQEQQLAATRALLEQRRSSSGDPESFRRT